MVMPNISWYIYLLGHNKKEATNKNVRILLLASKFALEKSIIYVLHKCMYIYFGNHFITLSSEMTFCDGCIMLGNRNHIYGARNSHIKKWIQK